MILSRYERMIAKRYLLPGKGEGFIFLVAGISLVAVMLGVAALIIVMSVMNGFRAELFDKVVGLNGHAVIVGYGNRLDDWRPILERTRHTPGVVSATPLIEQPLMATHEGRVEAILLRGMTIPDLRANRTIAGNVLAGSLADLRPDSDNVAIGSRLATGFPELFAFCADLMTDNGPALDDRNVRARLANWAVKASGLKYTSYRSMSALSRGERPGPENSIGKLVSGTMLQDIAAFAMDMEGAAGVLSGADGEMAGQFQQMLLSSPSMRIAGGTDEILRNIIAERVLGLPRQARS